MKIPNQIALIIAAIILLVCCKQTGKEITNQRTMYDIVSDIEDSVRVGEMTIHNAFKQQILAHKDGAFDSTLIIEKIYKPNKYVLENCLSQIFGEQGKLFSKSGLVDWNRELLSEQESLIRNRIELIDSINLNDLFTKHLEAV